MGQADVREAMDQEDGHRKRILVGFAVEGKQYRDLLPGQSRLGDSPIEYTGFFGKELRSSAWKTNCRQRIAECDGMITLLSKNTRSAEGARCEIRCAVEERTPLPWRPHLPGGPVHAA